ncbi:MAG: glycosyltransferase family 39 protein [Chloroflexota bacterium]
MPPIRTSRRSDIAAIAAIVTVAGLIRLAFAFRAPVFILHDSGSYFTPAWDLVNGLGFDLSPRRTPVYPGFLAASMVLIGEDLTGLILLQHGLGVVAAALTYVAGTLAFNRVAGAIAGLLVAVNGALLVSEHYLMPEALLTVLLLSALIVAVVAIRGGRLWLFGVTGALAGVAVLCKPVAQTLWIAVPLVLLVCRPSPRRAILASGAFFLGTAAIILPWMARNALVHGSPSISSALGQTLVARTAKHDTGFKYFEQSRAQEYGDQSQVLARRTVQGGINQRLSDGVIYRRVQEQLKLTDVEVAAFMRDLATRVILDQPGYYLAGTARMSWALLVGEEERLRTDWKTQNARLSRDEWEERIEHLLAKPSQTHQNEFDAADAVVSLYQPARIGLITALLAAFGLAWLSTQSHARPALVFGVTALGVILVSAALDGPVARYRYPVDPLITLNAAGGGVAGVLGLQRVFKDWRPPRWLFGRPVARHSA